jgi:hypothetical protein
MGWLSLAEHAVPPQEPAEVPWQSEAFQLPGGWSHASEAVGIWAGGTQVWLDVQHLTMRKPPSTQVTIGLSG